MGTTDLKWLIERNHNAYLTHIGLWLTSLLGVISILANIASKTEYFTPYQIVVFFILYALPVGGMGFAVYRLTNIVKYHIQLANKITGPLNKEIFSTRGDISTFFVDDDGEICIKNRNSIMLGQTVIVFLLLVLVIFVK